MDDITITDGTETPSGTDQAQTTATPDQAQAAPQPAAPAGNSVTLSDGRTAVVRRGKGRDLLEAARRCNGDASQAQFEILSILTTVNGQPLAYEDLMAMDIEDVTDLMIASGSTSSGFTSPATSST